MHTDVWSPACFAVPGGSPAAWPHIKEIFQKTAAQTDGQRESDWYSMRCYI